MDNKIQLGEKNNPIDLHWRSDLRDVLTCVSKQLPICHPEYTSNHFAATPNTFATVNQHIQSNTSIVILLIEIKLNLKFFLLDGKTYT